MPERRRILKALRHKFLQLQEWANQPTPPITQDDIDSTRLSFGILCTASTPIVGYFLYYADSYPLQLGLFFAFCLAFFHAILGLKKYVSRRGVRATDYIYFLFVFIGLLMAAYGQQSDRSEAYMNLLSTTPVSDTEIKKWLFKVR